MPSVDPRVEFVLKNIVNLWGLDDDGAGRDVANQDEVTVFFDDPSCSLLQVCKSSDGTIVAHNTLTSGEWEGTQGEIHFIKLKPEPVTPDNIYTNIQVTSVLQSPIHALFHALHNVYAPALLRDEKWSERLSGKLQGYLADLEKGLGDTVRQGLGGAGGESSLSGILTPVDEFRFWNENRNSRERERSSRFSSAFEPVRSRWGNLNTMSMSEVVELVEETQNALDDVWKADVYGSQAYPQERMEHFFDIVGTALARYVQASLGKLALWTGPFTDVRVGLREAMSICEKWAAVVEELSGTFWPTHDEHPWNGGVYSPEFLVNFNARLDEVLRIRTTHEELLRLLSREERKQLRVEDSFKPFSSLQPLLYNPYTQPTWVAAVQEYEASLSPIESQIAANLRRQISGMTDRPQQLLREFKRYHHLLQRPKISKELSGERDMLLAQLSAHIDFMDSDFEQRSAVGALEPPPGGRNLSPAVNRIVWAKQLHSRVAAILSSVTAMLSDLPAFDEFQQVAEGLVNKLRSMEKEQFGSWRKEVEGDLDDDVLSLEMSGRVMDIDKQGALNVSYRARLVCLLREVRQLTELGHAVPPRIRRVADEGERYYRYGVMLKKVANFYNTMQNQIITEQRPMLLDSLLAFEDAVDTAGRRGGGAVTWSNPNECEQYVGRLQKAAERLSAENRRLRKVHLKMAEQVAGLMSVDLLRQRDVWKARWQVARDMMTELGTKYGVDRMSRWILHWDRQLYKALEAGYQMGLESLNENLPEIKAELVFTNRRLHFRPPLEELRSVYYREMKKFISTPSSFTGFGQNVHIFRKMADRNVGSLVQVYEKAESLFDRLLRLQDEHAHWTMLGTVDLDAYVEEHVREVADWDTNFKVLKQRRRESEKIPDFIKVDCISVSVAPFKAVVEDHMQRLGDALMLSLRRSVVAHLRKVDSFLETSMEQLKTLPRSIEEIGHAKKNWKDIDGAKPEMKSELKQCEEKKKLLVSMAGSSIDTTEVTQMISQIPSRWEAFELALEAFSEMIEEQRESLKGAVDNDVIAANQELDKFAQRWRALKPAEVEKWTEEEMEKVFAALEEWREQFDDIKQRTTTLSDNCVSFQMPPPRFDGLEETEEDMQRTEAVWNALKGFKEDLAVLATQDWISFRGKIYDLQDVVTKWQDIAKQVERGPVTDYLTEQFQHINKSLPTLKYCRGEPFKEEHWTQLFRKLGMEKGVRLDNLNVGHFLAVLPALIEPANLQFVKVLQARAQGEVTIREALQELRAWTETAELKLHDHEENKRVTPLIRDWKELFLELGDNQSLLASLKESQFFKPFADQANQYEVKMTALDTYLHNINSIQRKWVYLEPIFGRGALPAEQARFKKVDDDFRDIMLKVAQEPKLFNLADEHLFPQLKAVLERSLDQLERCQKALADFLEEKRSRMPRFYFIGDDDLLEILGQAKNPTVIQAHLKKLFQGIFKVGFSEDERQIVSMKSSAGEEVPLVDPVTITDKVEEWLDSLAGAMKDTLAALLVRAVAEQPDYEAFPSQVLCVAELIKFTRDAEAAVNEGPSGLVALQERLAGMLQQYTSYDLSAQPLMQLKVKALVLDLVHLMDMVTQLQKAGCRRLSDWIWQKQLRFYLQADRGKAVMRMVDAVFDYTYEYQGNASKLVHTPLTDKCYLTLTQGMHMGYGGNPYGPAGTGKTESVKALGNAFGRQVLVFNCDEGIDFQSMGRIFIGLVKCGAWGCFDEFNRLKEDQLSAVSQQIQVIQDAIKSKTPSISLLGRAIDVDFNAGIFVTLNPAGKGYGGRSKLPDNLKALFRPVAMGVPDNDLIAEVILYSEGFSEAKDLASKMVSLYVLSRQLLSQQQHYDWGLRALKAVLNTGGKLIQASKRGGEKLSAETERELLIKAVRINTLSKLTFADSSRFLALIGDVFPGVASSDIAGGDLEAAIREVMVQKPFGLTVNEAQVRKMLQLKESLDQRMGCVIVGPSGCGKSTVWRVLQAAMIKCGQLVKTHVMNPKSMPRQQLLGHMDLDTREWSDGVLTDAARQVVKEPAEVRSWVVCDGDVDPEWIESLNSVLDDNHLLTLPNGERINFGPNVNFLFETHDLRFASPATISRMGMIFLSDEDVDVDRLVQKWLAEQPEEHRGNLGAWLEDLFSAALALVLEQEFVVATTMVGTVQNGLSHITGVTAKGAFVCGLIRGLGANLAEDARAQFAKEIFQMAAERPPDIGAPLDCYWDAETGGYRQYVTQADSWDMSEEGQEQAALEEGRVVPTVSVQRTLDVIEPWVERMEPFILVGPEGCGKNMVIRHVFGRRRNVSLTTLHCNAQTTAEHVIQKIAQSCSIFSSNSGRVYRPRDSERLVLYLKDINLPKPDQYNTCMLIAFLQQLITFSGFYDENLEFLGLERVQIVASMNAATTVGRHPLSTRFTAIVRVACVSYPLPEELVAVYECYLQAVLTSAQGVDPKWTAESARTKMAAAMVELFDQLRSKFTVDEHRHYLFTPRDLTAWALGLLRYELQGEELLEVWAYEAQRLFRDRLVDGESEGRFDSMLVSLLRTHFKKTVDLSELVYTCLGQPRSTGADGSVAVQLLQGVTEEQLKTTVAHGMVMYEREEKELNVLLFPEVLDHFVRVSRVLAQPGGSLLLVGRAGVGRRTAATLVGHMHGYRWFTPAITRDYGLNAFRVELKSVLQAAGVDGEQCVLYVEDHQFTTDAVLETINSLLSAGEAPGLYTHEELEPLLGPLKELMLEAGGNFRTPYEFFVHRVRRNLHICLSMDPTNAKFLVRCESNPALYTRCTILWMGEWRRGSMTAVPRMLLGRSMLDEERHDDAERLLQVAVDIHRSVVDMGATPLQYIVFLKDWERLYDMKLGGLETELKHLSAGLGKLNDAASTVDELSQNAQVQQRELAAAQVGADQAMEMIQAALEQATDRRKEVEELRAQLGIIQDETNGRKEAIETELSSITPILESAKQAVGLIKSDNLNEIRSLKMPPEPIHDVLSAVLMLLGIHDTSWLSMKKFLGNRGVKEEILNFDAHRITSDMRKQVSRLLKQRAASFDHANIYRVSVAAAPLAAWVKANIRYSLVLDKIEPLEADLAEATRSLESSKQRLTQCEAELKTIDDKVSALKDEFAARTREAEKLRAQLEIAQRTLDKAQSLLGQLSGERGRWDEQSKDLREEVVTLPLQMLLASGFTTFLAKFPEDVRSSMLEKWTQAARLRSFDFTKRMTTESTLLTWKAEGLPADGLSQENGLVIDTSELRTPFIIDPANAATQWLKTHLAQDANRPLEVLPSQDPRFTSTVELAVRFGKTLLILEVDTVEPMLYPLVRRDLSHEGPRFVVQVGDKLMDFNDNFRLYLVTRNPDPDLPPDAAAMVTEVNFTVTRSGLEGQLLGETIQHEKPKLEEQKSELLKKEEEFKVQLAGLEKELLQALATSEGDILDNTALIDSLTRTKSKSAEIQEALKESAEASEELDRQRNVYRPFARNGSAMFFLMGQLQSVNHMYQFSLAAFLGLFTQTLRQDMASVSVEDRIKQLTPALEKIVLTFVSRSLFKGDRLMWALHLVRGMHPELFQEDEWELFTGAVVAEVAEGRPRDMPSWAGVDRAGPFRALGTALPSLLRTLNFGDSDTWKRWGRVQEAENDFPAIRGVTSFQRMLVVQALRPDRMVSAMHLFASEALGVSSLSPPPLSLDTLYREETRADTPVLIITTAGADPSKELEEFAVSVVGRDRLTELAMGGGQQEVAMQMLRSAALNGDWLALKNIHLVVAWLPVLEKELNSLKRHDRFRLWLTTESHAKFPPILLQQSLKVTFESPPGVKKNLQRTYSAWSPEYVEQGSTLRAQMLFLLAWFHAVVQERRTYIPQGWTKFYEFSFGDLRAGSNIMDMTSQSGSPDWETVHGLMENAIYGGRVDNSFDNRVLMSYLHANFNGEVLGGRRDFTRGQRLPNSASHQDYVALIAGLPDYDSPAVFGLPDNMERALQRANSAGVVGQLQRLGSAADVAAKFDREKWRTQLGPMLEMWEKMGSSVVSSAGSAASSSGPGAAARRGSNANSSSLDPVQGFVAVETESAQSLVMLVDGHLQAIKKVIYGTGLLTPAIQSTAASLLAAEVPSQWEERWEGPEKPQAWLRGLVVRCGALARWSTASMRGELLGGDPLNLADLFNPGTFLNALRQQTARELRCSMDSLKLVSSWEANRLSSAALAITIDRLMMQGANFDDNRLSEADSNAAELVPVPSVTLAYVPQTEPAPYGNGEGLQVPLYHTSDREKLLVEVTIPTTSEPHKWIVAGVALFLADSG